MKENFNKSKSSKKNDIKKEGLKIPESLTMYIPENIDLDKILKKSPPDFKYDKDYFIYILYLIRKINGRKKIKDIEEMKGYTPINAQLLQMRIRNYNKYMDYLIDQEILICDNYYINGKKSKGYKFTEHYNTESTTINISKYTLIKSITLKKKPSDKIAEEQLSYLKRFWEDGGLTIDMTMAKTILLKKQVEDYENYEAADGERYNNDKKKREEKLGRRIKTQNKDRVHPMIKYEARMNTPRCIKEYEKTGNYQFTVDLTSGRCHTFLTQTKKEVRSCIKYKGKTLCNVDIVNSQPFFASSLLNEDAYQRNYMAQRITYFKKAAKNKRLKTQWTQTNTLTTQQLTYTTNSTQTNDQVYTINDTQTFMLVKKQWDLVKEQDVVNYIDWVSNGTFYEKFGKILKEKNIIVGDKGLRGHAKEASFKSFFSQNSSFGLNKPLQTFASVFPNVYKIFANIKSGKNLHSTLACTLQNLEAELILHVICKRISEEYPHIPLFTIHDSIVTTVDYSGCVKQIMKEELETAIGSTPQIKTEVWKEKKE